MIIDVQLQAVRRNRVSKNYIEWYCLCVGPRAPQVYCRPPQAFQQHGANYVLAHWSPGYGSFYGKAIYPSSKPCVVSTTHFTVSEDTVNLAFSNLERVPSWPSASWTHCNIFHPRLFWDRPSRGCLVPTLQVSSLPSVGFLMYHIQIHVKLFLLLLAGRLGWTNLEIPHFVFVALDHSTAPFLWYLCIRLWVTTLIPSLALC